MLLHTSVCINIRVDEREDDDPHDLEKNEKSTRHNGIE